MVTKVKGCPYFFVIITKTISSAWQINNRDWGQKEVGTTLDLCYHPYCPCLYAFWYSIPTFFSIFCNCFLYLYKYVCACIINVQYTRNSSREKTYVNWWENGTSRRKLSWITHLYHLLSTKPSNNHGKNLIGKKQRNSQCFLSRKFPTIRYMCTCTYIHVQL